MRYCGRNGFIPTYFSKLDGIVRQSRIYVEEAAKAGRHFRIGQRQNIVRWLHIGDTEADYHRKLREYDVDIYKNFYGPFFPQFPTDPNTDWVKNISESGIYSGGTLNQVRLGLAADVRAGSRRVHYLDLSLRAAAQGRRNPRTGAVHVEGGAEPGGGRARRRGGRIARGALSSRRRETGVRCPRRMKWRAARNPQQLLSPTMPSPWSKRSAVRATISRPECASFPEPCA